MSCVLAYQVVDSCGSDCVHQVDSELKDEDDNEEIRHFQGLAELDP